MADVARYVVGCVKCQKSKADRHSWQTKLVAMAIEERPCEKIAIDFVEELRQPEGFHAILVVGDQYTKVPDDILVKTTCSTNYLANSYINDIWKQYSLLKHITSDRILQFALRLP